MSLRRPTRRAFFDGKKLTSYAVVLSTKMANAKAHGGARA